MERWRQRLTENVEKAADCVKWAIIINPHIYYVMLLCQHVVNTCWVCWMVYFACPLINVKNWILVWKSRPFWNFWSGLLLNWTVVLRSEQIVVQISWIFLLVCLSSALPHHPTRGQCPHFLITVFLHTAQSHYHLHAFRHSHSSSSYPSAPSHTFFIFASLPSNFKSTPLFP